METMVALIKHTHKNVGPVRAKLHWSGLPILVAECVEIGKGFWGHEIFFKI